MEKITPKLNGTGLSQVWAEIVKNFATKEDISTIQGNVENIQQSITNVINTSSALKYKGTIEFTNIPTENVQQGDVYNISDEFVTTDIFIEGIGKSYPAGTNIAYTGEKWDVLSGSIDLSNYVRFDDITDLSEEEIAEICVLPASDSQQ